MSAPRRPYRAPKLRKLGALGRRTRLRPGGMGKFDNPLDKSLRSMS